MSGRPRGTTTLAGGPAKRGSRRLRAPPRRERVCATDDRAPHASAQVRAGRARRPSSGGAPRRSAAQASAASPAVRSVSELTQSEGSALDLERRLEDHPREPHPAERRVEELGIGLWRRPRRCPRSGCTASTRPHAARRRRRGGGSCHGCRSRSPPQASHAASPVQPAVPRLCAASRAISCAIVAPASALRSIRSASIEMICASSVMSSTSPPPFWAASP